MIIALFGIEQQALAVPILILAFGMLIQYRLIKFTRIKLITLILLSMPFFVFGGVYYGRLLTSLGIVAFFLVAILMVNWIFTEDFARLEKRAAQAENLAQLGISTIQLAHSAKANLSAIRAVASDIKSDPHNTQLTDLLEESAIKLDNDIKSLLIYARATNKAEREPCNMAEIVHSVVRITSFDPVLKARVSFEESLQPVTLTVSPLDFRMAAENMVRNAAEAIYATGRRGTVKVSCTELWLMVEDNGRGIKTCMDCTNAKCVDCKQFAIGKTTKPTGTGLGVLQVQDFCRSHGFGLIFEQLEPTGTRVCIRFNTVRTAPKPEV